MIVKITGIFFIFDVVPSRKWGGGGGGKSTVSDAKMIFLILM